MSMPEKLSSSDVRPWILMGLLATVVAILGGSSRPDAAHLVALRPLAALFFVAGLYYLDKQSVRNVRYLLYLLGALLALMVVQIVPLPPVIWHNLPGREPIVAMDRFLGLDDLWRPISMNPWRGWNALSSMVVPMAAFFLAIAMRANTRMLLILICALGALDALLGLLQVMGGADSPLYLYEYTNRGSPSGIFANENHSAVFSACVMLVLARLMIENAIQKRRGAISFLAPLGYLVILSIALVGSSRAGFVAILGALVVSGLMALLSYPNHLGAKGSAKKMGRMPAISVRILIVSAILFTATLPALFYAFGRLPAFADLVAKDPLEDIRLQLFQVLWVMVKDHWLVGVGFGAFEQTFHIYEPTELLRPRYVNQAHNDWAQLIIEGGLLGVAILVGLLVWIISAIARLKDGILLANSKRIFWLALFATVAFASVVDYPLRAPIFQLSGVWFLVALANDLRERAGTHRASGG